MVYLCGFNREQWASTFSHFITFESTKKKMFYRAEKKTCTILAQHMQTAEAARSKTCNAPYAEAEFLDVIGTKVISVSLLY